MQSLLGLDGASGADRRTRLVEKIVDEVEIQQHAQPSLASRSDDGLISKWRSNSRNSRRIGVGEIDDACAPRPGQGIRVDSAILQAVDRATGQKIERAARRWCESEISHHIDVARECAHAEGRWLERGNRAKGGDRRLRQPQPRLKIRGAQFVIGAPEQHILKPREKKRHLTAAHIRGAAESDRAAQRRHVHRARVRVSGEVALVIDAVIDALGQEEGVGHRTEQHVAASADLETALAHEKCRGQPVFFRPVEPRS